TNQQAPGASPGLLFFAAHVPPYLWGGRVGTLDPPPALDELPTQVGLPHRRVVEQILPSAGELDLPGLENVGSIGDAEGPACVLLDQQDRGPVAMDLRDGSENLVHPLRRETEREPIV